MKERLLQKELFGEFEEPRKKKPSHGILPKNYMLFNISYEQIIFISIAVIMLMVLLFSLGVERGKRLASGPVGEREDLPSKRVEVSEMQKAPGPVEHIEATPSKDVAEAKEPVKEKKVLGSKLYTIQVIAYRSKKSAQKELVRLGKKGFNPFIIIGGGYYQICVGEYNNQKEAEKGYRELKKTYKDSFIRKR